MPRIRSGFTKKNSRRTTKNPFLWVSFYVKKKLGSATNIFHDEYLRHAMQMMTKHWLATRHEILWQKIFSPRLLLIRNLIFIRIEEPINIINQFSKMFSRKLSSSETFEQFIKGVYEQVISIYVLNAGFDIYFLWTSIIFERKEKVGSEQEPRGTIATEQKNKYRSFREGRCNRFIRAVRWGENSAGSRKAPRDVR